MLLPERQAVLLLLAAAELEGLLEARALLLALGLLLAEALPLPPPPAPPPAEAEAPALAELLLLPPPPPPPAEAEAEAQLLADRSALPLLLALGELERLPELQAEAVLVPLPLGEELQERPMEALGQAQGEAELL